MSAPEDNFTILLVEDEENDGLLFLRALKKSGIANPIHWLKDGLEAMHYLQGEGKYADRQKYPLPGVVILDLKMPRLSGLELLAWIREHKRRIIPTIVMSSSRLESDIEQAYELGANTYMVKPADFDGLLEMVKLIREYWRVSTKPQKEK